MLTKMEDEDTYVSIGTAFDIPEGDETLKKRFDKHEQVAVDSKGRRRFHGAFTGGFSAGYFNTVGTKEGWAPSTFRSSRSSRVTNETSTQKPEDFMDEEDFSEYGIAPRKFMTRESFTPGDKEVAERKRTINQAVDEGVLRSAVPGGVPIDDLIVASKVSFGVRLLRNMGWKEGQGVGAKRDTIEEAKPTTSPSKKVYGCSLPSATQNENDINMDNLQHFLAPKDLQPIDFKPKDNTHGIGYSGIDTSRVMFLGSESASGTFKPTGLEKRGIRGQAFGIGAFEEEDDDIYSIDDMSDYDFASASERDSSKLNDYGWSGPPKRDKNKGVITGFERTSMPTATNIVRPPLLPSNFIPKHNFSSSIMQAGRPHKATLTSKERGLLLGETEPKKNLKSVFDIVPEKDKAKIENVKNALASSKNADSASKDVTGDALCATFKVQKKASRWDKEVKAKVDSAQNITSQNSTVFKPFANDSEKQRRYDLFLSAKKLGKEVELKYDRSVTEWEKEREIEEFTRASILYRPMSASISSRFIRGSLVEDSTVTNKKEDTVIDEKSDGEKAAKLGLFGKLTREIHDWYPSSLLCKRFNVPDPYPHSQFTGTVGRGRKTGTNYLPYLETTIQGEQSAVVDDLTERSKASDNKSSNQDTLGGSENEEEHRKEVENPIEHNLLTKANSLRKTPATSGPLSYLNNDDVEQREESSGSGKVSGADELGEDSGRPSMDLFKAIFADTSDSSGSESDNEKEAIDDSKNEIIDSRNQKLSTIHANTSEIKQTRDNLENKNDGEMDMELNSIHHSSSEAQVIVLDKEADRCSAANRLGRPDQPLSGAGAKGRGNKSEELAVSLMNNKDEKGDNVKEEKKIENKGKKKKKDKKKKEKKKKKKKEKKLKKSRNYEKDSSSEWSSYSEEDDVASKSISYDHVLSNKDRKTGKLRMEKNTKEYIDAKHKSRLLLERGSEWSTDDVRERKSKRDKDKQSRRFRETAKTGRCDELPCGSSRSRDEPMTESSSGSFGVSRQSLVTISKTTDSSKTKEKSEENVPSAAELYQRLKKHGLTLKRMSAADFM